MYNSPTFQTERAALLTRTSTVTVPWKERGYEMPHWIWALCWDTGVARLCWIYNVMRKTALCYGLSHLASVSVAHNAGPRGVKCSEWSSPSDIMCAPRCCQNDLAVTWWEVLNVTWSFTQQKVRWCGSASWFPETRNAVERQAFRKPMPRIFDTWIHFMRAPVHLLFFLSSSFFLSLPDMLSCAHASLDKAPRLGPLQPCNILTDGSHSSTLNDCAHNH